MNNNFKYSETPVPAMCKKQNRFSGINFRGRKKNIYIHIENIYNQVDCVILFYLPIMHFISINAFSDSRGGPAEAILVVVVIAV